MSNLKNTRKKTSNKESKTVYWMPPLSLEISENSSQKDMQTSTKEKLTLFLGDFHVSHSQLQEKEPEPMIQEICGHPLAKLSTSSSLDTPFWKMSQALLVVDISETFYQTWQKSGIMQNGCVYPLPKSEQSTKENGSGLWATPNTLDGLKPKSAKSLEREATVTRIGRSKPANLRDQVGNMGNWPTPSAVTNHNCGRLDEWGGCNNKFRKTKLGSGDLNPDWVEWLMGWPIGWSDLKPIKKLIWLDWDVDPADKNEIPRITTEKQNRINRLKAIGNGQVPQVAATAWRILTGDVQIKSIN